MFRTLLPGLALAFVLPAVPIGAAEVILPQNRTAFYCAEEIELAVAGLKKGEPATIEIVPAGKGLKPVSLKITGDGSTVLGVLPANALAPSAYTLRLDGKDAGKLTISSGVNVSPLLLSATVGNPKEAGANFFLGNAFGFGLLDHEGKPALDLRGRRSSGMQAFDNAVRDNLPTVVYMYWTGYVTHKAFGSEKSWAARDMNEATRLLSFHTAQRLRRYHKNIVMVGTLDEPGLSWGKTPAGGMASGFPNWDEEAWYAKRGWKYTQDPASRSDADWMKYMTVRCAIMKEVDAQAKKDLTTVWPGMVFSTDLYAPQAVMDGTDPLNQQINDIPSSHVFLDWGVGKLGALSGLYLEKAHKPESKIAHAMNGQLFGEPVPQPNQRNAYRLMLNAMLAAGLYSNWWLNPTAMKNEDLAWVNEPAQRLGGLFAQFAPKDHDVAVLWSFTEICMREKDVTAREAKKKTGEQIKLMIASLPDIPGAKDKRVDVNAYNIGGNYKEQVMSAHQALARAGYPAHIIHERIVTPDLLKRYKTLVIVGQTFDLPAGVKKIIDEWSAKGGTVIVDETTKAKFDKAIVTKADFRDPAFRWGAYFALAEKKDHPFKNNREASVYHTNWFMDEQVRRAVGPLRETMNKTQSQPAIDTDSVHLAAEKHTAGKASLYMVINAFDKLPEIAAEKRHWLYNYAPYEATFTLKGIPEGSIVYCIDGQDWKRTREVKDWQNKQNAKFEPGEMKLYLVVPRGSFVPGVTILNSQNSIEFKQVPSAFRFYSLLGGGGSRGQQYWPTPQTIQLLAADGSELYRVYRASSGENDYRLSFPLGGNRIDGPFQVILESLNLKQVVKVSTSPVNEEFKVTKDPVRVFDEPVVRSFLQSRPSLVIALGSDEHKPAATKLAADLAALGIKTVVKPEKDVLRKVAYPRVWNPFATVYSPTKEENRPRGFTVKTQITLGNGKDGTFTAKTADGKDVSQDWRLPNSLVTIAGDGWVDFGGDRELCYEPGVKLYFDERREMKVINAQAKEMKTTAEFRAKWAKPWSRLTTHVGAYQLPAQLPEAYTTDSHLIVLGDIKSSQAAAILQASELLPQTVDAKYPGLGKALVQYAWSPFAVGKNAIIIGASDKEGLQAGIDRLLKVAGQK
jgi:hypothetical protein